MSFDEMMTERYICTDCKEIADKEKKCPLCEDSMKKVVLSTGFERWVPYLIALLAALLLIAAFLLNEPILIWFTFPLIAAGLLFDHMYQKQLEEAIRDMI